jgi:two-component system chemotaxis response regulator CheB
MATPRDLIVIGGSAGGFEAVSRLVAQLGPDLAAAVAVVLHRSPDYASDLAAILGRKAALPVREPSQGEVLQRGHVYVAPRDLHMRIEGDHLALDRGAKQHHTRPAIDPLFESAAAMHGRRVIGVLLTGNLSDGVAGLLRIKSRGGLSLVQDPGEAKHPSMPRNALIYDHVDLVFRMDGLAPLLAALATGTPIMAAAQATGARPVKYEDDSPRPLARRRARY